MRPIEPGCRVVICGSAFQENNGIVATVTRLVADSGDIFEFDGVRILAHADYWELDKPALAAWPEGPPFKSYLRSSATLRRVDDDWGKTTQWDESIWTPHKQGVTA